MHVKHVTKKNEFVEIVWPANSALLMVREVSGSNRLQQVFFFLFVFCCCFVVFLLFWPKTHYLLQSFAILFAILIYLVYLLYCKICDPL